MSFTQTVNLFRWVYREPSSLRTIVPHGPQGLLELLKVSEGLPTAVPSLRWEYLAPSLPHRVVPHGLHKLLQHQKNSEESLMEEVKIQYLWQWVVLEPSSPHRMVMVHLGLQELQGQQIVSMELPTETVHL